jgi:hypothetical protein
MRFDGTRFDVAPLGAWPLAATRGVAGADPSRPLGAAHSSFSPESCPAPFASLWSVAKYALAGITAGRAPVSPVVVARDELADAPWLDTVPLAGPALGVARRASGLDSLRATRASADASLSPERAPLPVGVGVAAVEAAVSDALARDVLRVMSPRGAARETRAGSASTGSLGIGSALESCASSAKYALAGITAGRAAPATRRLVGATTPASAGVRGRAFGAGITGAGLAAGVSEDGAPAVATSAFPSTGRSCTSLLGFDEAGTQRWYALAGNTAGRWPLPGRQARAAAPAGSSEPFLRSFASSPSADRAPLLGGGSLRGMATP